MNRQQLAVLEQTLELQLAEATGVAARQALVRAHLEAHTLVLASQRAREQVEPDFVHVVDGARDRPLDQAQRMLVTLYDYRREVAAFALRILRKNSPVKSGLYRDSHTIFVNGQAVAAVPPRLKTGDKVLVANPVPYARRLEVGKRDDGSPVVLQVPPGIYERSLKEIRRRYGQAVKLSFGFVDLAGAHVNKGRLRGRYKASDGKLRKRNPRGGEAVRFPAIFIEAL